MTLTEEIWDEIQLASRRVRLSPESGFTADDIAQEAAIIVLRSKGLEVRNPRGLANSAVRFAALSANREKHVRRHFVYREITPEAGDKLSDYRGADVLQTDLRLDASETTLKRLKEVYCG